MDKPGISLLLGGTRPVGPIFPLPLKPTPNGLAIGSGTLRLTPLAVLRSYRVNLGITNLGVTSSIRTKRNQSGANKETQSHTDNLTRQTSFLR